jgi:hypothetical protein
MTDYLAHRNAEQLAGAETGVRAATIVVRNQDRVGLLRENGPEQQLQLIQAIAH